MYTLVKNDLSDTLRLKIEQHIPSFELLPAVAIVHDLQTGSIVYISQRGLDLLGTSFHEIETLSREEYHRRYFNDEDAKDYVPKIIDLLHRNNTDEILSHFQQVRYAGTKDFTWHLSSIKIFERDQNGQPKLGLALAIPVDAMHHMTVKAARLLEENNFLRKNIQTFSKLTRREKQILRLITLGSSSVEIASQLFISTTTAETHRRNIRQKLNCNSAFELSQYARAFDLI